MDRAALASARLAARADLQLAEDPLGVELDGVAYRFDGASRSSLVTLLAYADGKRPLAELHELSGHQPDFFSCADAFAAEGLGHFIGDERPTDGEWLIEPARFGEICRKVFPSWKARVFGHRLWTGLADGSLDSEVFRRWLLESYHFIEGANVRLPYAVAFCHEPAARRVFAEHYAEEWDHGKYYLAALEEVGLTREAVLSSLPAPATAAVLNHMRRAARVDPLAYAVCSGFLESTGEDRTAGRTFLERLDTHYAAGRSVAAPLLEHLDLDEGYGHNGLLESICATFGPLTERRASEALDVGFRLVETLEYWSDSLLREGHGSGAELERFRLSTRAHVSETVGTAVEITTPTASVRMDAPQQVCAAIASAATPTTLGALASRASMPADALRSVADLLLRERLAVWTGPESLAATVDDYLDAFHANCEVLAAEVTDAEFWRLVTSGAAHDRLITGWAVEFFHFVEGSDEYMPVAAAQAPLPADLRHLIVRHCIEESDHGVIFAGGLEEMGLPLAAVRRAAPLPTTAALLNMLTELANSDILGYLATFAVMQQQRHQAPASEHARMREHLTGLYPASAPLFDALHKHAMIDVGLEHADVVFDTVVRQLGPPSREQRRTIGATVERFAVAFRDFFDGILSYYGQPTCVVPRRKITVGQFL